MKFKIESHSLLFSYPLLVVVCVFLETVWLNFDCMVKWLSINKQKSCMQYGSQLLLTQTFFRTRNLKTDNVIKLRVGQLFFRVKSTVKQFSFGKFLLLMNEFSYSSTTSGFFTGKTNGVIRFTKTFRMLKWFLFKVDVVLSLVVWYIWYATFNISSFCRKNSLFNFYLPTIEWKSYLIALYKTIKIFIK